jgi:Tfp pilus assembly protein FimT
LIEIVTMAVIVGVVAAMAAPRFQQAYERMQFRAANREIVSNLRLARSMAITDKSHYGVVFDYTNKTMTVFQDLTNPGTFLLDNADPVVRQDTLAMNVHYLITDVVNNTVTFGPNGAASFAGGGNILVFGATESVFLEHYHNVLRSTGRVRSYDTWEEWSAEHLATAG